MDYDHVRLFEGAGAEGKGYAKKAWREGAVTVDMKWKGAHGSIRFLRKSL